MKISRMICASVMMLAMLLPTKAHAQQRELVSGVVRSARGDSVSFAHIHVSGGKVDTTVRAGIDGRFSVVVQRGTSRVTANMIGFAPMDTSIDVNSADVRLTITLHDLAQQIATFNVNAMQRGIRGIIGDSVTMRPIPGVLVSSIARQKKVFTDSEGRFEIDLPVAEQTTMRLVKEGYLSRPATVPMLKDSIADVVYFMTRGQDAPFVKNALLDLENRASLRSWDTFIANREDLTQLGAKTVADGVMDASVAGRRVGPRVLDPNSCVFIDGRPMPGLRPWSIPISKVDMLEYYPFGTDKTKSLSVRWPLEPIALPKDAKGKKFRCDPLDNSGFRQAGGPWIVVWTRH